MSYQVAIKPLSFFRASEEIDLDSVRALAESITLSRLWLNPIAVDHAHGIVMDGNHRLNAARTLGLKFLPCVALSYDDPRLRVRHWATGEPFDIPTIVATVCNGRLFPYKSTRHLFDPQLPSTKVPLDLLRT